MKRNFVGVTLLVAMFADPVNAATWAILGGYYPGMSKDAAKKAGLKDCKEEYGRVRCSPTGSISLGQTISKDTSLHFNPAGSVLEKIVLRFPAAEMTDQQVQGAAESIFGKGSEFSDSDSNCLRDIEWLRNDDERVHLCVAISNTRWKSHYLELKWEPGLGKRLAKNRQYEQDKQKKIKGFNTN